MLRIFIFVLAWALVCFGAAAGDSNNAAALLNLLIAIVGAFVLAPFEELGLGLSASVQACLVCAGLVLLLSFWRAAFEQRREAIRWACLSVSLAGFAISYRVGMTAADWMRFT